MHFVVVPVHVNLDRDVAGAGVAVRDLECNALPRGKGGARGSAVGVDLGEQLTIRVYPKVLAGVSLVAVVPRFHLERHNVSRRD